MPETNHIKKVCCYADLLFSDLDRIQTCNPQSRNLIFYSVELRSQGGKNKLKSLQSVCKCKIILFPKMLTFLN